MTEETFGLTDVALAELAKRVGGSLVGDDIAIRHLRPISASNIPAGSLSFAVAGLAAKMAARPFAAGLIDPDELESWDGRPAIVHPHPHRAFFGLHTALAGEGRYGRLEGHRGAGAIIASTAVVHPDVWIGEDVVVEDHAVIRSNTVLGNSSRVQAGTVVGGDGFQVVELDGRRTLIPHAGGVRLGTGVVVGSNCCIDRGLLSTWTSLEAETMLDNMVHVAHDVVIGQRCTLTATVELSGSVVLEDDVWLAPRTCSNQLVRFGRGAYTGTGSVVVRDVAPFGLVRGNPARPAGWMCLCRAKLPDESDGNLVCDSCGRHYLRDETGLTTLG